MRPLVISMGDPAGIGPEILAQAWHEIGRTHPFAVVGSADVFTALNVETLSLETLSQLNPSGPLPVLHRALPEQGIIPGTPKPAHAPFVVNWISEAAQLVIDGHASALITAPISKKNVQDGAGFRFPGHTEYLAHLTGAKRPIMMLTGAGLRVVPVTIHIPLSQVPGTLTTALLEETLRGTHDALKNDFGIPAPRIAVAGLNPHAGEDGAIGTEDLTVIRPVIERLCAGGMHITGPLSADTMFHHKARQNYDAAVCMYHDQALVPLKTLAFDEGVNVTLGLPIIRTSPDHGTAFDIAGRGIANPSSMIAAIETAAMLAEARAQT